jgi:hypothetical protein
VLNGLRLTGRKAEWRIPAERMKMKELHIVPLSRQAVTVLRELEKLNGDRTYVFPNQHNPSSIMSENAMLYALYRMGYADRAPDVPAPYMGYFVILNYGESFGAGVMRPFVGRTSEGITVNSTPDEIIAAYGKPTDTTAHKNAKWLIYADHVERERLMMFAFVDGKINLMYFVAEEKKR